MEDIRSVNEQIKELSDLIRKSNDSLERLGLLKEIENKKEVIFDKEVKPFGSGSAHIILPARNSGHRATIIIKKNKEESEGKK